MIFPADVKVDADQNVWMISDRMPNFLIDTLDFTDINFRIFTARLDDLIADTICDPRIPARPKNYLSSRYDDTSLLSHATYSSYDQAPVYHSPSQQLYPQPAHYYNQHTANHHENSQNGHTWGHAGHGYHTNYHFSQEAGHHGQGFNRFW